MTDADYPDEETLYFHFLDYMEIWLKTHKDIPLPFASKLLDNFRDYVHDTNITLKVMARLRERYIKDNPSVIPAKRPYTKKRVSSKISNSTSNPVISDDSVPEFTSESSLETPKKRAKYVIIEEKKEASLERIELTNLITKILQDLASIETLSAATRKVITALIETLGKNYSDTFAKELNKHLTALADNICNICLILFTCKVPATLSVNSLHILVCDNYLAQITDLCIKECSDEKEFLKTMTELYYKLMEYRLYLHESNFTEEPPSSLIIGVKSTSYYLVNKLQARRNLDITIAQRK